MYIPLINNMMNRRKLPYVVPETRKVQVLTESGICAGSNVSVVQKDDKPLVEVDKWDEIGQFLLVQKKLVRAMRKDCL